jgi:polar amino acid transport system substrate-binding protein
MNQSTNPEARRDPRGVVVDVVARELGVRLGIPVRFVAYDRPALVADAAKSGEWDIAFPAIEPARATMILFSRPYATIEASYLVRENALWRSVEEFDQTDMRIAVARGSAYDLFLTRSLMAAQLVRGPVNRRGGEGSACWKRRRCGWHSPL